MRAQRGFALLELLLATMVSTLVAVWGVNALVSSMNDAGARAAARWMLSVRDAAGRYLVRHGPALALAGDPGALRSAGYADWAAPTTAELQRAGLLAQGLPLNVTLGAGAQVRVVRQGACPGHDCRATALIHSAQPLRHARRGDVDQRAVSQWLLEAGGAGGWVSPASPGRLRGPIFDFPNPPSPGAALPAGTVALLADDNLRTAQVVHIGDARDPRLQGGLSVGGDMRGGANLAVAGHVRLGARGQAGQSCPAEGAIALSAGQQAGLLVCRAGAWTAPIAGQAPAPPPAGAVGSFTVSQRFGCRDLTGRLRANPQTGDCSCLPSQTAVRVGEAAANFYRFEPLEHFVCVN